jgi:AcrR family transcriptional regulator
MTEPVVKRRNRPNRYSDELLLDAAAEVFHRHGFHEASMIDIAEAAGATKPTLYTRFGGKEQLYDLVLDRIAESLIATMTAAYAEVESATPEEATEGPVNAFFGWVRAHPTGFSLLFADDHGTPTGIDHRERALGTLTELITKANTAFLLGRGLKPGRATGLLAAYFVGVFQHGARWAVENDALDRIDIAAFTSRFILSGLEGVSPDALSALARRRRST